MNILKNQNRGHVDYGWLKSAHTFSFGNYQNPDAMGFSVLRVINEDQVAPGAGFPKHPHNNMEIISYVVDGALQHQDSLGNGSIIAAGDIQFMRAGTGIAHSEFNASTTDPVHFFQIWVLPSKKNLAPAYGQHTIDQKKLSQGWLLLVSGNETEAALHIMQDLQLYGRKFLHTNGVEQWQIKPGRHAWLQVLHGELTMNNQTLLAGDAAYTTTPEDWSITAQGSSEILLFDLPATPTILS